MYNKHLLHQDYLLQLQILYKDNVTNELSGTLDVCYCHVLSIHSETYLVSFIPLGKHIKL